MKRLRRISKFMSLILRHEPETFGVLLDPEGYVAVEALLDAMLRADPELGVTREDLVAVVETVEADKQRFAIVGDGVDDAIRANYGHSLAERIEQVAGVPPPVLYHGTNEGVVAIILSDGLSPMNRQYVHLTTDSGIADRVGSRRGAPVLLLVDAAAAHGDGVVFYRANDTFWLVDELAASYLSRA